MSQLFIGLDLGTTGIKAGVFDAAGAQLALTAREVRLETPAPGLAEFDADGYAAGVFECLREVLAAPGVDARAVRAAGLSSQAQTFVLLGADGRPVRPAVSWLDVRAGDEARELSALAGRKVDAISSCPKILWLRRREPATLARTRSVCLLPDYIILRLTGRAATDPQTAWSTGAYDWRAGHWAGQVLEACGLRAEMMPAVLRAGQPAGRVLPEVARELPLPAECLAAVGANDQSAGALGAGNAAPGCASLTLGTALAIIATAGRDSPVPPGLDACPHPAPGLNVLLAFAKTAGIVLRWLRDEFAPGRSYDDLFREAATVPPGAEGLCCLPHFSGTATPDFNPAARGAFAGLTLAHGRAHLVRAVAESLAFTVRENLELIGRAVPVRELRAIGGGAASDVWLQMIADVAGLPVERPRTREAACLGAAEMAMVAAGRFPGLAQASAALYAAERRFAPDAAPRDAYDQAHARYRELYRALYGAGGGPGGR